MVSSSLGTTRILKEVTLGKTRVVLYDSGLNTSPFLHLEAVLNGLRLCTNFTLTGEYFKLNRDSAVYETYNGSLKAFRARFSITTTTTAIVAMSTMLKTRSGSHYRVYITVFPLHLAVLAEGLSHWPRACSRQHSASGTLTQVPPDHCKRVV